MKNQLSTQQASSALQVVHSTFNFEVLREPIVVNIGSKIVRSNSPYQVLDAASDASNWDEAWFHHYE